MQLEKIYKLIDYQIARMREVAPQDQIVSLSLAVFKPYDSLHEQTHMVLSGGLGSSPYVKAQLKRRYVSTYSPSVYARNLRILTSTLP